MIEMMKSSMGYHTFSLFQRLSMEDEAMLDQHFFSYMHNSGQMKMTIVENEAKEKIGIVYSYKNSTGIKWLVMNRPVEKGFRVICVIATITPMVMLNKDYIGIANES
ncbi:MAG: hypothetical protein FWE43_04125, partial [Streptococcaceae bacterium]|nr:hypothetical protein [Streptococcaceae bacterium]